MARRVTITLDEETATLLDEKARQVGREPNDAVVAAIRQWTGVDQPSATPFRIEARLLEAKEGVDFECIGRALGELDDDRFIR